VDIPVGTRLGPYELVGAIGAGGMGQVYKARDTRLERTVAIKVVPADLAADPEFRQRFDREARAISQLNHPNICTLHDVGEDGGVRFLVLEYLEGETLAQRLSGGRQLSLPEVLSIAIQIADALDRAHKHGIVHRDLKPGNIMLTRAGAKLLDFGLAKAGAAAQPISTQATTFVAAHEAPLTARGTLLGTFQYMAPEQIEGGDVDARTDIWAFGCVVYEILTGRRPFEGKSQMSVMGAILERDPPSIGDLQPIAPPALARLVRTCLAKAPDDRFQSAHDLCLQLQWIQDGGSAVGLAAPVVVQRKRRDRVLWLAIAAATGVFAAGLAWWFKPAPPVQQVVTRFRHWLPDGQNFTRPGRHVLAISPDGTKIVYVANQQLYLRTMDQLEAQPIRGTNEDPLEPVFSPDGQWVAYFVPLTAGTTTTGPILNLKKIAVSGGLPITLGQVGPPFGADWRNGLIVTGVNAQVSGIQAVSDAGGPARMLVTVDGQKDVVGHPQLLDDGKHLVFVSGPRQSRGTQDAQIVLHNIENGTRQVLVNGGTDPRLLPSGLLVYAQAGALSGVPFDISRMQVTGSPTPLLEGVEDSSITWSAHFAVSSTGTLVFRPGSGAASLQRTLVWVDRQGREQPLRAKAHAYQYPRLSPDGTRIAVNSADEEDDVWIFDLKKDILTRLTFGPASEVYSPWMPDGRSVIFSAGDVALSSARDLFRKAADGTGTAEPLTRGKTGGAPVSISPDGKMLVTRTGLGSESNDLMVLPLDGSGTSRPLLAHPKYNERNGEISPDGRWIAYDSNESGRQEVFVRPFPNVDGGRWQISSDGGSHPAWSRSGHELFFTSTVPPSALMSVAVTTAAGFTYEKPQRLFDISAYYATTGRTYDVGVDPDRFLLVKPGGDVTGRPSIVVVSHWLDEVRARMSSRR